jgi:hypothetical protein
MARKSAAPAAEPFDEKIVDIDVASEMEPATASSPCSAASST